MKNVFLITIFLCVWISCKKENDEVILEPIVDATYSFYNENSQIVYFGDTIKYIFRFKSSRLINFIDVSYFDDAGYKQDLDFGDYKFKPIRIDKMEDSVIFEYPIYINYDPRWLLVEDDNSRKISLLVDYYDTTGIVQTDTLPQFIFSFVHVENHQRLYNIASRDGHIRGFSFNMGGFSRYDFMPTVNCGGSCNRIDDEVSFMINIPNTDFIMDKDSAITKDFIPGWFAPNSNHFFVKVTKDFKYYNDYNPMTPSFYLAIGKNHLIELFKQNEPKTTKVENPMVGELYAFRYIQPFSSLSGEVYGLIEVTHIEDDHLTSLNGGNELDYIEFRTKYVFIHNNNQ